MSLQNAETRGEGIWGYGKAEGLFLKNMKSMLGQGLESGLGLNAGFLSLPVFVTMIKSVHLFGP